ncbi:hypothetical protein HPB48_007354 [Haemaphysalis longicornis]|uniref:Cuticular protein n=1 Tax=Haemaphysalis longicornis TaxID=44386 RepID=A0A9J6G4X4_HAELO|nr:hypothetical protein HPB48_007354 [Haemaphysalis longicornis]
MVLVVCGIHPIQAHMKAANCLSFPKARQQYSFGYEISDGHGNKQVRHEVSDGDNRKHGSYGFVDAHGVYRHVRYVADHNGFRATIDTNEPGVAAGYSAGAAYNRGKPAGKPVVLPPRPIPPPPHRGPPVFHEPVHVRPSAPVHGPVVQAIQALHKAVPVAPFPPSSVQYAPTVQQDGHSGGLAFIPSAPPLTAAASGGGFINPRSSHVTYVEEPSEHPFTNLRSSPPLFYEGYHQVHKHH